MSMEEEGRGEMKCIGPKVNVADMSILIWEEVRRTVSSTENIPRSGACQFSSLQDGEAGTYRFSKGLGSRVDGKGIQPPVELAHMRGHGMVKRVDQNGEALVLCRKCSEYARCLLRAWEHIEHDPRLGRRRKIGSGQGGSRVEH